VEWSGIKAGVNMRESIIEKKTKDRLHIASEIAHHGREHLERFGKQIMYMYIAPSIASCERRRQQAAAAA
jgi:hypothetical protein